VATDDVCVCLCVCPISLCPAGTPLSPSEKHLLAMSPSPSIQTLKELKRILDHHYSKLFHAGKLASAYGLGSPATAEM